MPLETDLQVFYHLAANTNDLWNSDNATNSGLSFGTYNGVVCSDLNGSSDYAHASSSTYNFSFGTGDFTFSVWAYPDSVACGPACSHVVFGTDYRNYELYFYQSTLQFKMAATNNTISPTATAGAWVHITIVRSGSTVTPYIDGVAGTPFTNSVDITAYSTPDLNIGKRTGASNYFNGNISDLCMWKRAITPAEISAIYAAGAGNMGTLLPPVPLQQRLESYWPLDTNSNDAWGSNNGTDTNMSYSSGAAVFNGSSSLITVPHSAAWITTGFTLMAWVNPSGLVGTQRFLGKGRSFFQNWVSLSLVTSSLQALTWGASAGPGGDVSGGTISSSTWQHVAMTWDGTTLTAYINGVSLGTDTDATFSGLTNTNDFIMGRNPESAAEWFGGSLDDAAFWSRELTGAEVAAVHAAGLGNLGTLLPDAKLRGMIGSAVHDVPGSYLKLEGMLGSAVHDVPASYLKLEGMFASAVHSEAAPPPAAGGPTSQGEGLQGNVLQGWGTQGNI